MKTAMYLRISDKDYNPEETDEFIESNSIDNQRIMILDYISSHNDVDSDVVEYVDDGYTGTNFDRPAFKKMLKDVKAGKVETIVIKDLSRLGRDYIETGDYIEQIFPLLGVRVIAINSNYDSNDHIGDVAGIDVAITNFINAMYSRDLSRKRKSSDRARWANGDSCVKNVPYGYERKLKTKEWVIDEDAGKIVEFIFQKAAEGWTQRKIVDALNERKVPPPGLYKKLKKNYKNGFKVSQEENLWDSQKIRVILRRKEYYGTLVAHKSESIEYNYSKYRIIPVSEQVEIENHHVPIISKEIYDQAQNIFMVVQHKTCKKQDYSLRSKLRCGNCRLRLDYRVECGREVCYCSHKKIAGKYSACRSKPFLYEEIENNVYELLCKTVSDIKSLDSLMEEKLSIEIPDVSIQISELESKVEILKASRIREYEMYSEGKISSEIYLKNKYKLTNQINDCENEIDKLRKQIDEDKELSKEIKLKGRLTDNVMKGNGLTSKMVSSFIESVYVHDNDKLEIHYTFDGLLEKAMERSNVMIKRFEGEKHE
ncbi:MAG: recombinase family protein [Eubacterium sp.]|nr:recombinase family protein [Eubacterium sp.]